MVHRTSHVSTIAEVLDREISAAQPWLQRVIDRTRETDAAYVLQLCRATLRCLRRVLAPQAIARIATLLPALLRGLWFEQWDPNEGAVSCSDVQEFFDCARPLLREHFAEAVMDEDVIAASRALFECYPEAAEVAREHLPEELLGEISP